MYVKTIHIPIICEKITVVPPIKHLQIYLNHTLNSCIYVYSKISSYIFAFLLLFFLSSQVKYNFVSMECNL